MQIQLTDHARSINLLQKSHKISLKLDGNNISFTLEMKDPTDVEMVEKWYMPTKRKLFYTLCRTHLSELEYRINKASVSPSAGNPQRPKDQMISDTFHEMIDRPASSWHIEIKMIDVVKEGLSILVIQGQIMVVYTHEDVVETFPLMFNVLDSMILQSQMECLKTQLINSSYYGIKKQKPKR